MTLKQLKIDLKNATLETARAWERDNEKTLFFFDFCSEYVSAWDSNMCTLREYFEDAMVELLKDNQ